MRKRNQAKFKLSEILGAVATSNFNIDDRDMLDLVAFAIRNSDSVETLEEMQRMVTDAINYERGPVA